MCTCFHYRVNAFTFIGFRCFDSRGWCLSPHCPVRLCAGCEWAVRAPGAAVWPLTTTGRAATGHRSQPLCDWAASHRTTHQLAIPHKCRTGSGLTGLIKVGFPCPDWATPATHLSAVPHTFPHGETPTPFSTTAGTRPFTDATTQIFYRIITPVP